MGKGTSLLYAVIVGALFFWAITLEIRLQSNSHHDDFQDSLLVRISRNTILLHQLIELNSTSPETDTISIYYDGERFYWENDGDTTEIPSFKIDFNDEDEGQSR